MLQEISGKLNVFKFIGTYDNSTGEWSNSSVPDKELSDFVFDLYENGTCFVETDQV